MKKRVLLVMLLTLGLGVAEWPAIQAADGDVKKDEPRPAAAAEEDVLKAAGLRGGGPALLDFLRKRTVHPVDLEKIKSLIKQLDNDSFQLREQASEELVLLSPLLRLTYPAWCQAVEHFPTVEACFLNPA
jgi:hypothetical protein